MNGIADARTLALYGVLAAIISLGLLIFAYFASDTGVTDVVIGAVTGFWLREATYLGKAVTTGATETNGSSASSASVLPVTTSSSLPAAEPAPSVVQSAASASSSAPGIIP